MSDFKVKMYQIQFRLGLRPRPRWGGGAYSAPQTPYIHTYIHTKIYNAHNVKQK